MEIKPILDNVVADIGKIVLGKEREVRLSLTCLLAGGHLLIEDLPGVGKTTLAHTLAATLGLQYSRIQFTSDLLPADVIGVTVFDQNAGAFQFHQGPVFSQLLLADEINRATPKSQSALLEAMEENQVSVEGETHPLPKPFFVIATQNPFHQVGTFPLPESQLDRFLIRVQLGYPTKEAERALLAGEDKREALASVTARLNPENLVALQQVVRKIHVSEPILDYIQGILHASRQLPEFEVGLSPRAGLALAHSARAWAMMEGRKMVIPDDVQAVLPGVVTHRLRSGLSSDASAKDPADILRKAVNAI